MGQMLLLFVKASSICTVGSLITALAQILWEICGLRYVLSYCDLVSFFLPSYMCGSSLKLTVTNAHS